MLARISGAYSLSSVEVALCPKSHRVEDLPCINRDNPESGNLRTVDTSILSLVEALRIERLLLPTRQKARQPGSVDVNAEANRKGMGGQLVA